jgi:regulator of sirC expression with transglutaminase-like and TPR domain
MSHSVSGSLRQEASRPALVAALCLTLLIALAGSVRAQIGGIDMDPGDRGAGGKNTIQGKIFVPGGRKLDIRAKVRLRGAMGADLFQMSDDSGAFTFWRVRGGTYTVIVDAGKDFEIATEQVDIVETAQRRNDRGIIQTVSILLQPKVASSPSKPGTVDASAGGVPEEARQLYRHAVESAQSGDRRKAIEELRQALAISPNFVTALNELGVQYMNLKEWDKAGESLRAAVKFGPEAFHPHLNLGILLLQLKDYKAAAVELELAVQKNSLSASAQFQLGRTLVNLNKYDAAEKALKHSISIGGEDAIEAHRYLAAVFIERRNSLAAADELELYLKLAPKAKDADRVRAVIKDLRSQASTRTN